VSDLVNVQDQIEGRDEILALSTVGGASLLDFRKRSLTSPPRRAWLFVYAAIKKIGRFAAGWFSLHTARLRFGATGGWRTPSAPFAPPLLPFFSFFFKRPLLPQSPFGKL
jgi:hypothetical protein